MIENKDTMKTKTIFLTLAFISILSVNSWANGDDSEQRPQRVVVVQNEFIPHLRINGYTFYAFDDKVDSYYSSTEYFYGKIKGGFQWGGGLEYMMAPVQSVELSYLRLDTEAPMTYYDKTLGDVRSTNFETATNYILIGSNRYFPSGGKAEPYAGLQAGVGILNIKNPESGRSDTATKFAWGIKAGVNLWASEKVGLKLQAGLNSVVQAAGGGFYFGTGGGGAGISTYSTFYQFYVGGGLSFSLSE